VKIGIYGGSFNPVHRVHVSSIVMLLQQKFLDIVYMVPTYRNPLNPEKVLISGYHRLAMVALATQDYEDIRVSDYDLKNANTYSYQTITYFRQHWPDDDLYFMLGMDAFNRIPEWKGWLYLVRNTTLVVFARWPITASKGVIKTIEDAGGSIIVARPPDCIEHDVPDEVSSSIIRKGLKTGYTPDGLGLRKYFSHPSVQHYINANNLYEDGNDDKMVFVV